MKPPPGLVSVTLLFWGWQTGFMLPGAIMALVLEGARWTKSRWEFSDDDFARIWTFCAVVFLAAAAYAFTASQGPGDFLGLFQNPSPAAQRRAGRAMAHTAAALVRWLPMIFFLFLAAQTYSSRRGIPLETISLILRRRWQRARRLGHPLPASTSVDISYPFFILCVFSASAHGSENQTFFWCLCGLLGWALWPCRARRFNLVAWGMALTLAVGLGYLGQRGLGTLQNYLGNLNPHWFVRFNRGRFDPTESQMELGRIGRVKSSDRILIRLQPRQGGVPLRLREASYRTFKGRSWFAEAREKDFSYVRSETNETTYVLLPGKTNTGSVQIACYLAGGKGLLPLPAGSGRLENLGAFAVYQSELGAVLVEGPGLVIFNAEYGPGPLLDAPGNLAEDLSVPTRELPGLNRVLRTLELSDPRPEDAMRQLNAFFQSQFTYSTWQGPGRMWGTNETPLSRFLLETRSGHCEFFATAGVLLLRQLGIPARYAVGYAVHEAAGRGYVVRQRDAHAWCLVWDEAAGTWLDFDPTPASWVALEGERSKVLRFFSDLWARIGFEFSKFRWGQTHLRQYLLWTFLPILVVLLIQIVFRRRRRQRDTDRDSGGGRDWPGRDSEFYQLERRLAHFAGAREPGESLGQWLQRLSESPALSELGMVLRDLLQLHYRYRFDPQGLTRDERDQLRDQARTCMEWFGRTGEAPRRLAEGRDRGRESLASR